ncbi:ABC transporter substrate-binding protein [uncultured Alsobacter sp.]|uniref:ABC transporter substrate-binding protein n=1 Tax=uncultured Alsobacter sp. TaxID=1748258 RepID=UPI0025FE7B52|nr:ABC transporter substrate-binding protein [uncultured Alsobacter sp.]
MTNDIHDQHIRTLGRQLADGSMNRREFVRFATLLGMAAPAAYAAAGLAAPTAARAQSMPKGGVLRIGTRVKEIKSPHTYSWGGYDSNISRQVLEYLTFTDEKGVTGPGLFEKWSVSPDLKTWTFNVRKGVKWHNGQEFTADHVIWNLKRVLDPEVGSSMIGLMKGYLLDDTTVNGKASTKIWDANAIEKVDDHTVRINCKLPQVAVPEHFFHYPMAIMHPDSKGVFQVGSVGTGPFTLTEFDLGKKAVLKAQKGYWGGDAFIDTMEQIDIGDDASAAIAALASKQLHGLVFADPGQYDALKALPHLAFYDVPTAETGVIRMRCDAKPFDNPKVRKAMRLAIDPEVVLKVALRGLGVTGDHHHCSPAHPDYAAIPPMKRDVAAAKKLLAEAGYANGISAEIIVPNDHAWFQTQAEACIEMWKEAGITIKLSPMPGAAYWDVWTKVPMGTTIWYHRPLSIMCLGLAYRTGVPWNESGYSNKEFDEILTQAEGTIDLAKRKELVAKLETIMQEDGPLVQPVFRSTFTFMDKRVKGFSMHPTNYMFGWKMGLEA